MIEEEGGECAGIRQGSRAQGIQVALHLGDVDQPTRRLLKPSMSEPWMKSAMAVIWSLPNMVLTREKTRLEARSGRRASRGDRGPDSGGREGMTKLAMARSGASIGAPGAMLNATCSFAVRQRSVAMDPWIMDPRSGGETHNFSEASDKNIGQTLYGPT